jgi:hypothetical protein
VSTTETPRSPTQNERAAGAWTYSPDIARTGPSGTDGRYVVVDLASPATPPRVLAGPAAVIWGAVDGVRDTAGIVAEVATQVELEEDAVLRDVVTFLESLATDGLLTQVDT